MELNFHCEHCKQELAAELSAAGATIQCPTCGAQLTVPQPDAANIRAHNPIASSAAAKVEHHFSVPVHDGPTEMLVKKGVAPLEAAVRESEKGVKIKCIRHTDCIEVGHDRFDEIVSSFLAKIGEGNLVNLSTFNYTHYDIGTQKLLTEYGVMIVYRT